ncbi:MAG: hypothetical protein ABRQ26_15015 [Syntrophomonadaceae bacterium]
MSYYIIDGMPVFLTWSKYYQLKEEITCRNKMGDDLFFGIRGWNSSEAELLSNTINEVLLEKSKKDIHTFRRQWANFSMGKDEAADNAWELLFDYCHLTKNAVLNNINVQAGGYIESYPWPAVPGRVFVLNLCAPETSFFKRLRGKARLVGRLVIDSEQIESIDGNLENFLLVYRGLPIRFSSCIEIA